MNRNTFVLTMIFETFFALAAMGLLSSHYPDAALRIMKKELEYHGHSQQTLN